MQCSPNGEEQLSNLSSNVPSKDESGPYGMTSRFVKVTLSRICWCKPKKNKQQQHQESKKTIQEPGKAFSVNR